MLKTKYERMNKTEKKKVIEQYKKTTTGKETLNRLTRLVLIGLALICYAVFVFVSEIKDLKWTHYVICIPLACVGLFFIIMSFHLRKKTLNNFVIKKK